MTDISGYQVGPLPNLRPILRQWIYANKKYGRLFRWQDVPWGYNERATLSTFAAAFWLAGGIALEEYGEQKGSTNRKTRGRAWGRCDLYASIRNEHYVLEAKILWGSLRGQNWKRAFDAKLNAARRDARRTRAHLGETKLGLLFVVPYVRGKGTDVSAALVNRFVEFLRKRRDACSAWTFPKEARNFSWKTEKDYRYPGTALLIKPLRRAKRQGD